MNADELELELVRAGLERLAEIAAELGRIGERLDAIGYALQSPRVPS